MQDGPRYSMIIEWSDEDECFVGRCPELFYGGCHGNDKRAVFHELCAIVRDVIGQDRVDG